MARTLPGNKGADYHFVRVGDKIYVVYNVEIGGGKSLKLGWRIDEKDYDLYGIDPGKVRHIGNAAFQNINVFGNVSELVPNSDKHPFQQFVDELVKQNGDVSWLKNQQFMKIWLSSWAEGLSYDAIVKRLEQTHWWQSRTEYQRTWELELSDADRRQQIRLWTGKVTDALEQIYGPGFDIREYGFDSQKIGELAKKIASGQWGSPDEGFDYWFTNATTQAEGVEGSAAWIAQQQDLEAQNQYMNKPEDMLAQLKEDSFYWLGPSGLPSDETLKKWADKLVVGTRSQADWEQFLKDRSQALYPYLGANQAWQDHADPYKAMAEKYWGQNVNWEDPVLQSLGVVNEQGDDQGAMSFKQFERALRADDRFYQSEAGHEEGMRLLSLLNEKFRGEA